LSRTHVPPLATTKFNFTCPYNGFRKLPSIPPHQAYTKNVMHQSIPAAPIPPPPGNCRAFAQLVSPGGVALANLAWTPGPAICLPLGYPRAFDTHVVSDSKSRHGGFYRKGPAVWPSGLSVKVKDWTNLWKFSRFYAFKISSLLSKAQLELSGTINVNRRTYATLITDFII